MEERKKTFSSYTFFFFVCALAVPHFILSRSSNGERVISCIGPPSHIMLTYHGHALFSTRLVAFALYLLFCKQSADFSDSVKLNCAERILYLSLLVHPFFCFSFFAFLFFSLAFCYFARPFHYPLFKFSFNETLLPNEIMLMKNGRANYYYYIIFYHVAGPKTGCGPRRRTWFNFISQFYIVLT